MRGLTERAPAFRRTSDYPVYATRPQRLMAPSCVRHLSGCVIPRKKRTSESGQSHLTSCNAMLHCRIARRRSPFVFTSGHPNPGLCTPLGRDSRVLRVRFDIAPAQLRGPPGARSFPAGHQFRANSKFRDAPSSRLELAVATSDRSRPRRTPRSPEPGPSSTGLVVRRVRIESLVPDAANPRLHGRVNLDAIAGSLRRFGQTEPLLVQKGSLRIIAGHGRLAAMRTLGWAECDVVELEVSATDATALAIALNRTAELAEWDEPLLARLLAELRTENAADGVGYTPDEIDSLLDQLADGIGGAGDLEDPGPGDIPEHPVTRPGDLWILDGHHLLCGDSTKPDDIARVLAGERASLLATDPPYLVDYDGTNHPAEHHRKAGRKPGPGKELGNRHWDAYVDPESSVEFFTAFLRAALPHCIERVPVYQWHASRRQTLVEAAWKANGLLVHQTIVWAKARGILTRSHFLWQHEPAFYGWPEGHMPEKHRRPPPNETTIWPIDQVGQQDGIHPTQKPLAIFERPIRWHTRPREICLEQFSGSGSQIIAAERLGRRCRAIEISPAFTDVAVRRWEGATGRKATLDGSDRTTFDAIAAERAREREREEESPTPRPRPRAKARLVGHSSPPPDRAQASRHPNDEGEPDQQ